MSQDLWVFKFSNSSLLLAGLPTCKEELFKRGLRHLPVIRSLKLKDVDIDIDSGIKASSIDGEEQCPQGDGWSAAVTHSPVDGWWASLGFTAEHHLPVPLQSLHRIHDAAWLLGEDRTLQDTALCGTTRKDNTTDLDTGLFIKQPISQWQKQADAALSVSKGKTTSRSKHINLNHLSRCHGTGKNDLKWDVSSTAI